MENNEYNGWTNYETWLVSLWIDNDSCTQQFFKEQAADTETLELSDFIKEYIEEGSPLNDSADLYTDLLNAAMSAVNWYEIAEAIKE